MIESLLGLPLERAQELLAQAGITPEIIYTHGRRTAEEGVVRVVRIQEGGRQLTCAFFPCLEEKKDV